MWQEGGVCEGVRDVGCTADCGNCSQSAAANHRGMHELNNSVSLVLHLVGKQELVH